MCLVKRTKKQPPPGSEVFTPKAKPKASKAAGPDEISSLDITNSKSTTNSSKESRVSSASATSLTNIREMLSDGPIIFQYKDLCKATDNFSPSKKLGASVYRGKLQKTTDIAIVVDKRSPSSSGSSFVSEIKNLGSVHHANLVRLLGGCRNGDHVYLVYDYVNGGNLRQYLHSAHSPGFSALPTWTVRIQAALDVAKGLEYLHHHTLTPTVHKYIKSSNILLDEELHVKIAYFGVARIRGETGHAAKEKEHPEITPTLRRSHSVKITGIHGYMAPEYVSGGVISTKLDVFAFGIVLLELLSGKDPVSFQTGGAMHEMKKTLLNEVIVSICSERDPKSRLRSWIDPVLRDRFPLDCAMKAAALARSCVDPVPENRPDMSKVAMTLLQIQMASQIWDDKMKASKDLLTSTMQAR